MVDMAVRVVEIVMVVVFGKKGEKESVTIATRVVFWTMKFGVGLGAVRYSCKAKTSREGEVYPMEEEKARICAAWTGYERRSMEMREIGEEMWTWSERDFGLDIQIGLTRYDLLAKSIYSLYTGWLIADEAMES